MVVTGPSQCRSALPRAGKAAWRIEIPVRPGANFTFCLPRDPQTGAQGAPCPRPSRREARRFWLRRPPHGDGGLFCLEVNTEPGMTETRSCPNSRSKLVSHLGLSFD